MHKYTDAHELMRKLLFLYTMLDLCQCLIGYFILVFDYPPMYDLPLKLEMKPVDQGQAIF